jgi:hypothetical protein
MTKTAVILMGTLLLAAGVACSEGPSSAFCDAMVEFSEYSNSGDVNASQLTEKIDAVAESAPEDIRDDVETMRAAQNEAIETGDMSAMDTDEANEAFENLDEFAADC